MAGPAARWTCEPYSVADADRIARALELSPVTASVLVRRGHRSVEAARRFLAAEERHDPFSMAGMDDACELILSHVRRGTRIVVHGDYDVDGVCSTAIVVEALRSLGAEPHWHLPQRLEGYGLSRPTVERLVGEGAGLLIAVDCGITSVAEIEAAGAAGLDTVVADHHRPGERLPPCPVLHPGLPPYPFDGLCAAGVAHKLAGALRARSGLDPAAGEGELDLVGLATVCDLVPLRGENRTLVREGLRALARTGRPGLQALMGVAALDPGELDERAVGFRLGPRLNAAGRLRRADAALELLLTSDPDRARQVADELDLLNRERRDVETRMLFEAEAARAGQEHLPVQVVAGEGWHPGVAGIVASRMTERHHRPCVVIAIDSDGGRGSGRSIQGFDLHAALAACSLHLRRFGGHRAAAGLEIDPERVEDFRRDLAAHAAGVLSPHDLVPVELVDAVVPCTALGLPLAEELRRLGPFGHGNPEPTLLVPGARLTNLRSMGEDGQHARFTLTGSGSRAEAVAFRASPATLARGGADPCDAAVRLELNEWNGRVEARVVLAALCPRTSGVCELIEEPGFWPAFERELERALEPTGAGAAVTAPRGAVNGAGASARTVRDRRGEAIAGVAGDLLSSGEPVLVLCADVARRRRSLEATVAGLRRTGALALASWEALTADPELGRPFPHLVAIDPPASETALSVARRTPCSGEGSFLHLAWGPAEVEFALAVARAGLDLRGTLAEAYRRLRSSSSVGGSDLRAALGGDGAYPLPPVVCGRLVRLLVELGLVEYGRAGSGEPHCRLLEAARTDLDRSPAHRAYQRILGEAERYLGREAARWAPVADRTAV